VKKLALTFVSSFFQIFFIAVQTKNIIHSNYLLAFVTSLGISVTWIFNTNCVVRDGKANKIAYALGAASGIVSAIKLYDMLGGK